MRISFVTENTIDVASDINDSLVETDGIIPMIVESIDDVPPIGSAIQNKYYANEDYVCTIDPTGLFYIKSYPAIILFENKLYAVQNGNWKKIIAYSEAVEELLACETLNDIKTYLGV